MPHITGMFMTDTMVPVDSAALYRLLAWMSPSFPIGAYTYSHGLETEVADERIADAEGLRVWIDGVLRFGAGRSDAILLRRAWDGEEPLAALNSLALALSPTCERRLESAAQGTAFLKAARDAWSPDLPGELAPGLHGDVAYPVAVGCIARAHDVPLEPMITSYLHALAANLVSAGLRLVPLGQTDGQRTLAALETSVADACAESLRAEPDDIGGSGFLADIASARHETLHTRLFRS